MATLRLLERIAGTTNSHRSTDSAEELHQSIVANVLNILKTARETVMIRDDFGMSSYHDIQTFNEETNRQLIADIAYQINAFEPRLTNLSVKCDVTTKKGPLDVVFQINANYEINNNTIPFELQLTFNERGQFKLKA